MNSSVETIHNVVQAPVVSHNSNSPEAIMARDAKKLQVQASTDSKYDTVLSRTGERVPSNTDTMEGFSDHQPLSLPLLFLSLGLTVVVIYGIKKYKH